MVTGFARTKRRCFLDPRTVKLARILRPVMHGQHWKSSNRDIAIVYHRHHYPPPTPPTPTFRLSIIFLLIILDLIVFHVRRNSMLFKSEKLQMMSKKNIEGKVEVYK